MPARPAIRLISLLVMIVLMPVLSWSQGDPLGNEFRINTYTTDFQARPAIALDTAGSGIVVWTSLQDGSFFGVYGQRFAASGAPSGLEFQVNTYTASFQYDAAVAADGAGAAFMVVWSSLNQDGSDGGVFGQRYDSTGANLGPEFRVNTYTAGEQLRPSVAADGLGNFIVVWTSYQGGSITDIFGQRYGSSGAPIGQEFRINTYTTSIQGAPSVAADSSGEFIVVWSSFDQDGSEYGVFGQRFGSSGAPVGPEFRVNTYTSGRQFQPAVADDVSGGFVVVWTSAGQDYAVFGQRYSALGAVLGPEFRVSGYARLAEEPSVAADPSGNFIVTWGGYDGYQGGVFGQRYASSGPSMGPEFRVNTYTTGHQSNPVVGVEPTGKFVIAWDSQSQDGSSYGIFGQRYGQIVPVELIGLGVE